LFVILNIMKDSVVIMPKGKKLLKALGENIKLARLRRKLSSEQVAERAGFSRGTLWQIEKGAPSVAMGAYFQVLFVLGLENDFLKLAGNDELGRKLQDAGLVTKARAPKKKANDSQTKNRNNKENNNESPIF
jgi:transcriptional regulator with XRE-family HTH domain